jgi:GMP synthase-like glutamine amidotransferase
MTNETRRTIGILQTGKLTAPLIGKHDEYPEMFKTLLGSDTFEYKVFAVVDGEFPSSIDECDGWVITGSRHGAYEDHDWIPPLEEFSRKLVAADKPTVGICFGHQVMAQAMGGRVEKFDGGWCAGPEVYTQTKTGEKLTLMAMHQDQVVQQPNNTEVILASDFCAVAGLKFSENVYSIQPHPEFQPEFLGELITARRGLIMPEDIADGALEKMNDPVDSHKIGERMVASLSKKSSVILG